MKTPTQTQLTLILGVVAVGVIYYVGKKALSAGSNALSYGVQAITPWSDKNLAYKAANAITSGLTGREETFGGWMADTFSSRGDAVKEMLAPIPKNPAAPPISTPSGLGDVVSNSASGVNFNYF